MRAVFGKELRELRIALFVIAVAGVLTGFALKCEADAAMGMIVAVGLLGLPLGAMQGWLDRAAVRDQFLLHRPVPLARLHAARTLAGAAAACVVAAVPLGVMLLVPFNRGLTVFGPLLDESSDPQWRDVTAGRVAFAALLSVAMWSVARLGASARRTPVAAAGALGLASALAFAVVRVSGSVTASVALVVAAIAVATWTNAVVVARRSEGDDAEGSGGRRLAWKLLACALAVVVTLEAAYWLRPWAHLLRRTGGSSVEVTADGRPELVVADWRHDEYGNMEARRRIYDDSGDYLRTEIKKVPQSSRDWTPAASPFWGTHWQHPVERLGHVLDISPERGDWADGIVGRLRGAQGQWSVRVVRGAHAAPGSLETRARFNWSFEDGRFVCRDEDDGGKVVTGFGPDGVRSGADAASGERFDRDRIALALALSNYDSGGQPLPFVLVDPDRRAVHFVRMDLSASKAEGSVVGLDKGLTVTVSGVRKQPIGVVVKTVAVSGPGGEPPAPLMSIARGDWMQFYSLAMSSKPGDREKLAVPVAAGPEIVEVNESGIVRRAPMDADESCVMSAGSDRFLWSILPPVDGSVPRIRIRWWREDGTLTRCDANVPPVTLQAKCGLALAGIATLLRPPGANALSYAGPRVADWDDSFTRWFTDPLVAGGEGGGWLAGSLAVAALCAWLARRAALVRSPNRVLAWTIAGAVLGVAGLAWMRLVVPRSHVATCACGRRRAAHVAACPSCAAAWPAPSPTGIEVFA